MASPINIAIAGLVRRAEQSDSEVLVSTFVDNGMLGSILLSRDHQVIYGRRGTGKTHALKFLINSVKSRGDIPLYIDLRTIGSNGSIYNDENTPMPERVSRLLVDVGNEVYNKLHEYLIKESALKSDEVFTNSVEMLDELARALGSTKVTGEIEVESQVESSSSSNTTTGGKLAIQKSPSLEISGQKTGITGERDFDKVIHKGKSVIALHFGATFRPIDSLLSMLDKRIFIMLDEWSSLPEDLQPYLADMLKRCFMAVSRVSIKIAAIEQRSNFLVKIGNKQYIGVELGSDISADVNLDDFMVFDNDSTKAAQFFADLFSKHIIAENTGLSLKSAREFISRGFTQSNAFDELVKAAEGVPRDAINIAILAAQAADADLISVPIVRSAARRWYQRDKEQAISANSHAEIFLRHVIDEVINQRRARAFLVDQEIAKSNELLKFLYDSRVLHILKRASSAKDQPGKRFTVFKIDYGCYVELLNTTNSPRGLFDVSEDTEVENFVDVPQDDYRSIRRAILDITKVSTST